MTLPLRSWILSSAQTRTEPSPVVLSGYTATTRESAVRPHSYVTPFWVVIDHQHGPLPHAAPPSVLPCATRRCQLSSSVRYPDPSPPSLPDTAMMRWPLYANRSFAS